MLMYSFLEIMTMYNVGNERGMCPHQSVDNVFTHFGGVDFNMPAYSKRSF
ncbi:hypothetical protein HMPREF1870_02620 [Bacteroidales bacterium KA00344]|nr:hypothetical protein HMPREF1870_02620 [Bacteroidales bacterium KA00344]